MIFRSVSIGMISALTLYTGVLLHAESEVTQPEKRPSLLKRTVGTLTFGILGEKDTADRKEKPADKNRSKALKALEMAVKVRPEIIKLSETRRIRVGMRLTNDGKNMVALKFPTTQRLEIRLLTTSGKVIEQWSESRMFTQVLGHVSINPGERLEYNETISVRDLVAGGKFNLEVSVPGYPDLTVVKRLAPER